MGKVGTPSPGPGGRTAHLGTVSPLSLPQSHPLALTSGPAPWVGGGVGQWGWEKLRRRVFASVWKTEVGGRPDRATLRTGSQGGSSFSTFKVLSPLPWAPGNLRAASGPSTSPQFLRNQVLGSPIAPQSLLSASPYSPPSHPHKSLKHLLNVHVPRISGPTPQFLLTYRSRDLGSRYR